MLASRFTGSGRSIDSAAITVIALFAIVVLPRLFSMGLVEAQAPDDLRRARFGVAA
jgi:hypothetical protein